MLRYQRNHRNAWKFPNQVAHGLYLLRPTAVDRDEYGVNGALTDDSNRIGKRVPVYYSEAAAPSRIDSGPLDGEQDRCNRR
jgi:hypothetical protein